MRRWQKEVFVQPPLVRFEKAPGRIKPSFETGPAGLGRACRLRRYADQEELTSLWHTRDRHHRAEGEEGEEDAMR